MNVYLDNIPVMYDRERVCNRRYNTHIKMEAFAVIKSIYKLGIDHFII